MRFCFVAFGLRANGVGNEKTQQARHISGSLQNIAPNSPLSVELQAHHMPHDSCRLLKYPSQQICPRGQEDQHDETHPRSFDCCGQKFLHETQRTLHSYTSCILKVLNFQEFS